ncbi:MAG TPA: hypothetical protein PKY97_05530 [Saprospiraceae bacterium]|nr:hypothetical protein [Saprospiraceae bacterium]
MVLRYWFVCLFFPIILHAQDPIVTEYRIIKDAFHIVPICPTTKGNTIGIGYARPIAPKWMVHGTVAYLFDSFLDGDPVHASGIHFTPSIIYFPGVIDNYKGFTLGVEIPFYYYRMKKSDWVDVTIINETGSISYEQFQEVRPHAIQFGLAGRVGLRTHKVNKTFFWQPNFCLGFLRQSLVGYTENPDIINGFIQSTVFSDQSANIAPYIRLEIAFGLYRYSNTTIKTIEF